MMSIERRLRANAIRALVMDSVQKANSGHPGAPMGMADIAESLWYDHLKHNPSNPQWAARDRFILSNGHASMLLYSLLHLTGYDLSIEDLKNFRQMHSKTPGHPELNYTPGVETTTGPLGQGLANAVGMALAEKVLAAQFNRNQFNVVDNYTYVFVGDGCLMEGISHEVCSLAGTLKLGKLIAFYDDNDISIDGNVSGWFTDDTQKRFEAYGWRVLKVDGHDGQQISESIVQAKSNIEQPTIICCKTIIGFGSPNKAGKESSHGAPLGAEEIISTRKALGWEYGDFEIPSNIYEQWSAKNKGAAAQLSWDKMFAQYKIQYPKLAAEFERRIHGLLVDDFEQIAEDYLQQVISLSESIAGRNASLNYLNAIAPHIPEIFGGSADLTHSNLTKFKNAQPLASNIGGNYLSYGVREFGMSAMANGMAIYGGFIPYVSTFLMFMEYAKNAIRMSSLMKQRVIYVFTHDSIGLGEDGPTHQPVEQAVILRVTPNFHFWRPADSVETTVAWSHALQQQHTPSAFALSRQNLPFINRDNTQINNIKRGGYILRDSEKPEIIIIATGSEISLVLNAYDILISEGVQARVVSMPSTNVFDEQDEFYKESVLPKNIKKRLAVEALHADFWYKYVGLDGAVIGMQTFGESAPAGELFRHFGFTIDNIVFQAKNLLSVQ